MYESSGSQFFRTTIGIQSGPDTFDESRFLMTFLTILGVTEISYSFRNMVIKLYVLRGYSGEITQPHSFKGIYNMEFLHKLTNISEIKSLMQLFYPCID